MKKYTNQSQSLLCVEFVGKAQFLRRGDSIVTDAEVIRIPEGVTVENVGEAQIDKKTKTVKNPK